MKLQEIIESLDYETRPYSGRAMYGKQCLGVRLDNDDKLLELGAAIAETVMQQAYDIAIEDSFEKEEIIHLENFQPRIDPEILKQIKNAKLDNLGKGYILYFPNVEYKDDEEYPDDLEDLDEDIE